MTDSPVEVDQLREQAKALARKVDATSGTAEVAEAIKELAGVVESVAYHLAQEIRNRRIRTDKPDEGTDELNPRVI